MIWVRLDCQAMSHPKLLRAGPDGVALWVSGLCFCNTHTTNGRIDHDMVPLLYPPLGATKATRAAKQLCKVGLWHDRGDHFEVHDYDDFQGEAAKEIVEAKREYERLKKREQRAKVQRPANVPGDVPPDVPVNVPDMSRTDGDECPGLSPRARTRAGARARPDRTVPTDPTDPTDPTERGETPPSIADRKSTQPIPDVADDIDDPWDAAPPLKPCWRLWRIWEEVACSGPDTGGDRKPHERALTVTYGSLEKRAPKDPEGLFRRMVAAFVSQQRAQGKRVELTWLLKDFAGWADLVERGTTATPNGHISEPDLAMRPELRPMPKIPKIPREVPQ